MQGAVRGAIMEHIRKCFSRFTCEYDNNTAFSNGAANKDGVRERVTDDTREVIESLYSSGRTYPMTVSQWGPSRRLSTVRTVYSRLGGIPQQGVQYAN